MSKEQAQGIEHNWLDLMEVDGLPTVVLLSRDLDSPPEILCRNPSLKQRLYYRSLAPSGSGPWFKTLPVPEAVEQTSGTFEVEATAERFRLSPKALLRTLELTSRAEKVTVDLPSSQSRSEFKLVHESGLATCLRRSELLSAVKAAGSRELPDRKNGILPELFKFAVGFETVAESDRNSSVAVVSEDGTSETLSVAQVLYCLHLTKMLVDQKKHLDQQPPASLRSRFWTYSKEPDLAVGFTQ